jgi:hypothetical protein
VTIVDKPAGELETDSRTAPHNDEIPRFGHFVLQMKNSCGWSRSFGQQLNALSADGWTITAKKYFFPN